MFRGGRATPRPPSPQQRGRPRPRRPRRGRAGPPQGAPTRTEKSHEDSGGLTGRVHQKPGLLWKRRYVRMYACV